MKKHLIFILLFPILIFAQQSAVINLDGKWKFTIEDNPEFSRMNFNDSNWDEIKINNSWEKQGFKNHDGFAWYRIKVIIPSSLKNNSILKDSLIINLGKIDDFDQTFLNGKLIGINTRNVAHNTVLNDDYKNLDVTYWDSNRRYSLSVTDPIINWDGENTIAVRVYDWNGPGGIYNNNAFIRMNLPSDYLIINSKETSFIHNGNKWDKKVTIKNISDTYSFNGKFDVRVTKLISGKNVFSASKEITLKPGKSSFYTFSIGELHESAEAMYNFVIYKSGENISAVEGIPYILTPTVPASVKINGASVYGERPNRPFLYRIPASGNKPIKFTAENLPEGLSLDSEKGIISGKIKKIGTYRVKLIAENQFGKSEKIFTIKIGNEIALTPPMGWNSWNVWGLTVDAKKVKNAANAFIKSGLAEHGWQYINIDDGWSVFGASKEPKRTSTGEIKTNEKFPDMKKLGNYIHSLGLKFGIYTSPGPLTCGKYTASYRHELQDVQTFAKWGIDYVKYDLCSYRKIAPDYSRPNMIKPYEYMHKQLQKVTERDIVYSICQYGIADVWQWGEKVGGNLWRTTGDIWDDWDRMKIIGFDQVQTLKYSKPGHWNDPDMLVVGKVGWGPHLHNTMLTPDEQYTHISQWVLLAAPLLIGCDLNSLDEFTLNLLTNDEVIAIDQDPLGKSATPKIIDGNIQVWMRPLADGNFAIGIFNLGEKLENYRLNFKKLGIKELKKIRDVWRQKDVGSSSELSVTLPTHSSRLLKIFVK